MNSNTINVVLTAIVITLGTVAMAGWLSPLWLRWVAVQVLARAEAIEAARTVAAHFPHGTDSSSFRIAGLERIQSHRAFLDRRARLRTVCPDDVEVALEAL